MKNSYFWQRFLKKDLIFVKRLRKKAILVQGSRENRSLCRSIAKKRLFPSKKREKNTKYDQGSQKRQDFCLSILKKHDFSQKSAEKCNFRRMISKKTRILSEMECNFRQKIIYADLVKKTWENSNLAKFHEKVKESREKCEFLKLSWKKQEFRQKNRENDPNFFKRSRKRCKIVKKTQI